MTLTPQHYEILKSIWHKSHGKAHHTGGFVQDHDETMLDELESARLIDYEHKVLTLTEKGLAEIERYMGLGESE